MHNSWNTTNLIPTAWISKLDSIIPLFGKFALYFFSDISVVGTAYLI